MVDDRYGQGPLAGGVLDPQSLGPQNVKVGTTSYQQDLVLVLEQAGPDHAADRSRSIDHESHCARLAQLIATCWHRARMALAGRSQFAIRNGRTSFPPAGQPEETQGQNRQTIHIDLGGVERPLPSKVRLGR